MANAIHVFSCRISRPACRTECTAAKNMISDVFNDSYLLKFCTSSFFFPTLSFHDHACFQLCIFSSEAYVIKIKLICPFMNYGISGTSGNRHCIGHNIQSHVTKIRNFVLTQVFSWFKPKSIKIHLSEFVLFYLLNRIYCIL